MPKSTPFVQIHELEFHLCFFIVINEMNSHGHLNLSFDSWIFLKIYLFNGHSG